MRETVQVLPVGIDATRKKPGDRFRNAIGMTDAGFEFVIPIYENMPGEYGSLP